MYKFSNSDTVKGFKCEVILECPGGAGDSAGKCILNLFKAFNLRESSW